MSYTPDGLHGLPHHRLGRVLPAAALYPLERERDPRI